MTVPSELVERWKGEKRGIYVDMIGLETLSNLGGGLYFKDRKIRGYRAAGHVPF